jgi:hypothetical protein
MFPQINDFQVTKIVILVLGIVLCVLGFVFTYFFWRKSKILTEIIPRAPEGLLETD